MALYFEQNSEFWGITDRRRQAIVDIDLESGENVPVGHIWKFDLVQHEQRDFGVKWCFSKIRIEHVILNFLATTENLRYKRSERPNNNRGKKVKFSSGKLLLAFSDT